MTRRGFLRGLLAATLAGLFAALYGFLIEPALRLRVRRWRVQRPGWPAPMRIAILSDLHMGAPHVTRDRLRQVVKRTNALGADLIVVLGDLNASHPFVTASIPLSDTVSILADLAAPQGVFAVLGNHDWWEDSMAQARRSGPVEAALTLQAGGIPVLQNETVELPGGVVLAGLGDQWAFKEGNGTYSGVDDLPGTLAQIPDTAHAILLAHEPDIFTQVPARIALTLSGHTHGGQVRLFGWSPVVPSRYRNRFAYGHVHEDGRDLVVSGGIGCSILPVRLGVVPEITVVELSA
ncbi:metallophosphoesterase [Thalassococcus sp. S3]|uniref:metallophosphoesterase n=1 Tax=Thalassococcus sp. S3 TaxID=2017482 RepID=UPI001C2C4793|nr:metallophosphoesterase [Thalassococcus sp. S3]